jgi:hypothetical protein
MHTVCMCTASFRNQATRNRVITQSTAPQAAATTTTTYGETP